MIVIIDYGMGNTGSILNMIRHVGCDAVISADANVISKATALILPGVGAFDHCATKLQASGLVPVIEECVLHNQMPFLGICVGMQLLFGRSEEGELQGLNWIHGQVKRFNFDNLSERRLKIPHMGWNNVISLRPHPLFEGLDSESRFYFVHSYHAVCDDASNAIAHTRYGYQFTCAVQKNNIYGVQFHPEKSHKFGIRLFKNFVEHIC